MKMKTCSKCKETKILNGNFNPKYTNRDGYNGQCRACVAAYHKIYQKAYNEKKRAAKILKEGESNVNS